jgi:hypothetical protein
MSTARGYIKGLYCRGKLYAIGGYTTNSVELDSCEAYDIATGRWSSIAPLPLPIAEYEGVTWRDSIIYVLGGWNDALWALSSVWIYNPSTDSWTVGDSMPSPLGYGDACIVGDSIYTAGGITSGDQYDGAMRVGRINPRYPGVIDWTDGPTLPAPRAYGPVVSLAGKVYWFGGWQNHGSTVKGYVYDPAADTITPLPDYPVPVMDCCLAVARGTHDQIYGLAGDQGSSGPPAGYYCLGSPDHDVGVIRIIAPSPDVDSGDKIVPSAEIGNFGRNPEGFRVMLRISGSYSDFESTYVQPGESAVVDFAPWTANCRGRQFVKCSTMLAADTQPGNDVMSDSFTVHFFDAGVASLVLSDTEPPGNLVPIAVVQNYNQISGELWVDWQILRDDTLSVYAVRESVYLLGGQGTRYVTFPAWNATSGGYLAKVFATHGGALMHDTVTKQFWVVPPGIEESDNEPLPTEFALDIVSANPSRVAAVALHYALPQAADIKLTLYDATGKLRAVLNLGHKTAGWHSATFDVRDSRFDITSGIYFVRLDLPGFKRTRKVVITQ